MVARSQQAMVLTSEDLETALADTIQRQAHQ
jgi:hypothetical protein